jgi:flagellar hook-length control protein FliK
VAQVAGAVIDRVVEGGGEARLRLDPPDLGEVLIHVRVEGGHVHVDVHADSPEAVQLLKDSTPNLSSLLGERGLGLADVSVDHRGRDGHQQPGAQDASGNRGRRDDGSFAALLGIDAGADTRQHNRIRAAYNPDGVFVYRV